MSLYMMNIISCLIHFPVAGIDTIRDWPGLVNFPKELNLMRPNGLFDNPSTARHVQSVGVTTMGRLAGKNILITGGNSGIGLAAAQEFDREGARVAICGLNERSLQAAK